LAKVGSDDDIGVNFTSECLVTNGGGGCLGNFLLDGTTTTLFFALFLPLSFLWLFGKKGNTAFFGWEDGI